MNKYVVIDVGGSSIKHCLMNNEGIILEKGNIKTKGEDINLFIESIGEIVDFYKEKNEIKGLACSFPGAVNVKTGVIGGGSAVPCIHGPNIKELLERRCNLKVSLENDANCAGLAEGWIGVAKGISNYACIVVGTGIGGCIVVNNTILRGKHLHGGEFGYMFTRDSIKNTDNTWSTIASTNALVNRVSKVKNICKEKLNGEMVFKMANEGDEEIIKEIDNWYMDLARGIFNIQYIIDPEKIVIGGAISKREDFTDKINEKLKLLKDNCATLDISVEKCKFNNDSNLIGALYNFLYV
ncbi:ROK family protein [Clostridium tarantellae]|uniref:ROK family protein n=1 Tax=Clostridium tarantellae TaxID=39493 RepID=A0A6I1MSD9_9CLOT|nr:ROK family protein [Clostridium tarantellae]MPQ43801.1 ROK family protein [Clostridium tarantellae]